MPWVSSLKTFLSGVVTLASSGKPRSGLCPVGRAGEQGAFEDVRGTSRSFGAGHVKARAILNIFSSFAVQNPTFKRDVPDRAHYYDQLSAPGLLHPERVWAGQSALAPGVVRRREPSAQGPRGSGRNAPPRAACPGSAD